MKKGGEGDRIRFSRRAWDFRSLLGIHLRLFGLPIPVYASLFEFTPPLDTVTRRIYPQIQTNKEEEIGMDVLYA